MHRFIITTILLTTWASVVQAEIKLPAVFTDHMVLQRDHANRVWGRGVPNEKLLVTIAGQSVTTQANDKGEWKATLKSMSAGGPHTLSVKGSSEVSIKDVLIGEVWVCSGQSNMSMAVGNSKDKQFEILSSDYPKIRLLTVPRLGTQKPQEDFEGAWQVCSPETSGAFSAVGYFFGRDLHRVLDVPIGVIHTSWGGSAAEAWVRRDVLAKEPRYKQMLTEWDEYEASFDADAVAARYEKQVARWKEQAVAAKAAGKPLPRRPRAPRNALEGQHRPANLYNGMLRPLLGYGIRGAIWYQGESNSSRAAQYRHLFPLMITNWRQDWGIGDFPFYWVQLADFRSEVDEPGDSDWAELREAQTMTLSLPNTGQAVILDLGNSVDIHPKKKQDVARRLARVALGRDYKQQVAWESASFQNAAFSAGKAVVTFKRPNGVIRPFDSQTIQGFAIAGKDRKFYAAQVKSLNNGAFEVSSEHVPEPVAVRYAWADNPICNLFDLSGLPVAPFRSDDWPGITDEKQGSRLSQ